MRTEPSDAVAGTAVDPITQEVIKGVLRSAQAEMEAVIERTSMSPFIREKKDYFAGILDRNGEVVLSTPIPLFGNLTQIVFDQYPADTMKPGDLYWYNDCYASNGGVSHSPDMVFLAPVFVDGELVALSQTWGHFWDIGGLRTGSISPDAREIYHEGIIVPAVKIIDQGQVNDEAMRIFLRNSRFPDILRGDIQALLAGCRLGERRLHELFARFGVENVLATWAHLKDRCHNIIKRELNNRVPDGVYQSEDAIDSDGVGDEPYFVRIKLTKSADHISMDTRTSDDQAVGPINFMMHENVPRMMIGIYTMSGHPEEVLNHGAVTAIDEVLTRDGSILHPQWPAPLGSRAHTMIRVQNNILGLLAQATGGQVSAPNPVYNIYFLRGFDTTRNELFLCSDGVAIGYGARPFSDGLDAIYYVAQKNYPAEFMEMIFPMRLRKYAIHPDSGGPGRFRGGCGVIREFELLADEATIVIRQDNVQFPPWGVNGGLAGRSGRTVVNAGQSDERELKPMSDGNLLRKGDILTMLTAGGGGWGNPLDRPADVVSADVANGFVSIESAERDYCVVLDTGTGDIMKHETRSLRERERSRRPFKMFHRAGYYGPEVAPQRDEPEELTRRFVPSRK